MRCQFLLVLLAGATVGCGSEHTISPGAPDAGAGRRDSGPGRDGGSDGGFDAAAWPGDVCGDQRGPLDLPPEPIINGTDTWDPEVVTLTDGQALAVGAIMIRWESDDWENICTATVVAPNVVVTAAHCVLGDHWESDLPAAAVRFAVGEDVARPLALLQPSEIRSHRLFNVWDLESGHDVSVLLFDDPITDRVPELEPIPVNCSPLPASILGQRVQHVGYGVTDPWDWETLNTRRWWTVEEAVELTSREIVYDGHGLTGECYGDSGGPSLWRMPDGVVRTIGAASWIEGECGRSREHYSRTDESCDLWDDVLENCDSETWTGHCALDVAVYCEGGLVVRDDCAERGRVCGETDAGLMRCVLPPDPCLGETYEGRCQGDTAIWCEADRVHRQNCRETRELCGATGAGLMRCLPDPCRGVTWRGRCMGDSAVWCEDGELRVRRCDLCDQVCGWHEGYEAYYCL